MSVFECRMALVKLLSLAMFNRDERQRFRRACRTALRGLECSASDIVSTNAMVFSTASLHAKTFAGFKNRHFGKDVVIVATGPSASEFVPMEGAVYIGVNNAFRDRRLVFDYLFAQDYSVLSDSMDKISEYRKGSCVKFFGIQNELNDKSMHKLVPDVVADRAGARRYRTRWWGADSDGLLNERFAYDLETQALATFNSVVFPALQFALWTNPRRIFLVGCDCSGCSHANFSKSVNVGFDFSSLVGPYAEFKEFASWYYPDTEIVSVNPVGLKGLFKDLYQHEK